MSLQSPSRWELLGWGLNLYDDARIRRTVMHLQAVSARDEDRFSLSGLEHALLRMNFHMSFPDKQQLFAVFRHFGREFLP